jgi:hypothetical protein
MTIKATPNFGLTYPESGDHTRTWEYWQTTAEQVDTLLKSKFVQYAADGSIKVTAGGITRPLPFATQCGGNLISFPTVFAATLALTFTASRFTQAPIVTATASNQAMIAAALNVSAAGFTLGLLHHTDQPLYGDYHAYWQATQMLPTSGAGRSGQPELVAVDEEAVPVVMTCHTADCDNAGIPITMWVLPDVGGAVCTPCGQPITDHTPA